MAAMTPRAAKPLAAAAIAQLEADGVGTLIGTVVNPAGLTHTKTVPLRRMGAFADPGLGASPVWHVFTIDHIGTVIGTSTGVVGDERIRIDLSGLAHPRRRIGMGARRFLHQDGSRVPTAVGDAGQRHRTAAGDRYQRPDRPRNGVRPGRPGRRRAPLTCGRSTGWPVSSNSRVRARRDGGATAPGVASNSFTRSTAEPIRDIAAAAPPVAAADALVLMRIIISRVARKYGMRVSLSPVPFAGAVGSGAHQHFSMNRGEAPLSSPAATALLA